MCFIIDSKYPNKDIAKKDIVCYKVLWDTYHSQYFLKYYEKDELYIQELGNITRDKENNKFINRGIHSYSDKKRAFSHKDSSLLLLKYKELITVKCIIPKGSEFYYNSENKEYISNQIIIKEKIK